MKLVLKIISYIGLVLTIVPSLFVFKAVFDIKVHFNLMIVGMVLWFGTAPFYAKGKSLSAKGCLTADEKEQ
jgi:hypothetical protein